MYGGNSTPHHPDNGDSACAYDRSNTKVPNFHAFSLLQITPTFLACFPYLYTDLLNFSPFQVWGDLSDPN